jgi:hypothetical protein
MGVVMMAMLMVVMVRLKRCVCVAVDVLCHVIPKIDLCPPSGMA